MMVQARQLAPPGNVWVDCKTEELYSFVRVQLVSGHVHQQTVKVPELLRNCISLHWCTPECEQFTPEETLTVLEGVAEHTAFCWFKVVLGESCVDH